MQNLFQRIALAALALLIPLTAAHAFEGTATVQIADRKMPDFIAGMDIATKGKLSRIDATMLDAKTKEPVPNMPITVRLTNETTKQTTTYIIGRDKYVQDSVDLSAPDTDAQKKILATLKPTGRREKIAGYEAVEYAAQLKKDYLEVWTTQAIDSIVPDPAGSDSFNLAFRHARSKQGANLRIIIRKKKDGPEELHMEVLKVTRAPQPDALFIIPAGMTNRDKSSN